MALDLRTLTESLGAARVRAARLVTHRRRPHTTRYSHVRKGRNRAHNYTLAEYNTYGNELLVRDRGAEMST